MLIASSLISAVPLWWRFMQVRPCVVVQKNESWITHAWSCYFCWTCNPGNDHFRSIVRRLSKLNVDLQCPISPTVTPIPTYPGTRYWLRVHCVDCRTFASLSKLDIHFRTWPTPWRCVIGRSWLPDNMHTVSYPRCLTMRLVFKIVHAHTKSCT